MKRVRIGGQAVMEGVMMKNGDRYAVAVRKPDKDIEVKVVDYVSMASRSVFFRVPIIRGVVNFVESLVIGVKTLTYSASFYDDEEPEKAEKEKKEKKKERTPEQQKRADDAAMIGTVLFSLVFGAEHKTINCFEAGVPLTPENVKKYSRYHKRCGTSFLFIVMIISIIVFMFISADTAWLRLVIRLLLVPVIAGISYEFIMFAGKSDSKLANALSVPGMWVQRLTTREPDLDMIAVAIKSVEAVIDWEAYQDAMHKGEIED